MQQGLPIALAITLVLACSSDPTRPTTGGKGGSTARGGAGQAGTAGSDGESGGPGNEAGSAGAASSDGGTAGESGAAGAASSDGGTVGESGAAGAASSDGGTAGEGGTAGAAASAGTNAAGRTGCGVPTSFKWASSAALISPPTGSVSIKDPTVVYYNGKWHVYATHYDTGYNMVYLSFADWADAGTADKTLLSTNPNLTGYKCAPQLFFFAPQNLWYLVYQTQPPAYSTSPDPSNVASWSARQYFIPTEPAIVTQNKGTGPGWIDFWVICDDANCYLFFSDDNGHLYRSQTAKSSFPTGFGVPVIALQDTRAALFEAANVYKIKGTNKYLLIHEAMGNGRYFRSWTADSLDGTWTPLATTQAVPFASTSNVTGASWSNDGISHGEMLRDGYDETMVIDTCNLRYLFQGRTAIGTSYDLHQYSLGLLTAVP